MVATTARRTHTPSVRCCRSHTLVDLVVRLPDDVTVTPTVFAAVAPLTALVATLLSADSTPLLFTTRTLKYQVAGASEPTVKLRALGSLTLALCVNEVLLVPYSTLKLARSVRVVPSVFRVGATQLTMAEPAPLQLQVRVKLVLP